MDALSIFYFGNSHDKFKPKQLEALEKIANFSKDKRDLIVNLPVGYGKSILYHLAPYILAGIVIVVSPLNIIQNDQLLHLQKLNIPACRIDVEGKVYTVDGDSCIADVLTSKFNIIMCHPEGLLNVMNELRDTEFCSKEIKAVFIDECHIVEEWGKEFRKGYHSLKNLPAVFTNAMFIGLSGTLTVLQLARLPSVLGMVDPAIIQDVPDRPNIYLSKICKDSIYECGDVVGVFENIYVPEIDKLYANPDLYPVTLMFLPMKYMSEAVRYITQMFGKQTIHASRYSCLYSTQDKEITDVTLEELKKPDPRIRLILATSSAGMGFDPVNITRVIHCCPPRCISRYLQEIGRAGRRNQQAEALLYFDNNDIKANLPGIQLDIIEYCKTTSCMRTLLLNVFGFEKNDKSPKGCMCCVNCRFCCKCSSCCN